MTCGCPFPLRPSLFLFALLALSSCGSSYSPDTYASSAVQQANKVERGQIVGVRKVDVSAPGVVGAVAGGAAGGALGAQVPGSTLGATFGAIGGTVLGGLVGATVEHTTGDTTAFEYIVRKPNGELVSVTQKDKEALALGQQVLVIAGSQARIVADYTLPEPAPAPPSGPSIAPAPIATAPPDPAPAGPAPSPVSIPSAAIPTRDAGPTKDAGPSALLPLAPALASDAMKL